MAIDSLMRKNWSRCPKKHNARKITIIDDYHKYLKMQSIPSDRQYWTLCGKSGMTPDDTQGVLPNLAAGCELDQILDAGLIKSCQFRGVEKQAYIHNINKSVKGINWINDDFYNAMVVAACNKQFNPSIINYDSVHFPMTNPEYAARIFSLVTDMNIDSVMIVLNMILKSRREWELEPDDILRHLKSSPTLIIAWHKAIQQGKPWSFESKCYRYCGTGKDSRTIMGTIVFYR